MAPAREPGSGVNWSNIAVGECDALRGYTLVRPEREFWLLHRRHNEHGAVIGLAIRV